MQIIAICPHCGKRRAVLLTRAEFVEGWLEPQACLIIVPETETADTSADLEATKVSVPPAPEPRLGERRA